MSHSFFEGTVYHKRYTPKVHEFTYPFYLLDIDLSLLDRLKNRLFSFEGVNLFSFRSKDHFGQSEDFMENVETLLQKFGLNSSENMHFVTLPRVANFVFNPISVLILFDKNVPTHLFAEVHNYNGGRVVYPVKLTEKDNRSYQGEVMKEMYVSPFLETSGEYRFFLRYDEGKMSLKVDLYEAGEKKLTASFNGSERPFKSMTIAKLFVRHSFLTFWVVTRTLWQSFRLWRKGLTLYAPTKLDQMRRY
ncbi:DUF1365 domain-containing protein [Sulfurovum sp. TSL6]|uniref:DUF1365 domain-containing protein n=1 Tax=Sulfurovum sp. TSL6 TaxID=2826995 RepID=UPI001CC7D489|nr:DUF1365 domain-containing protein [Sulfurovum sp. TSL6]GIT99946.1 DUF1365 domain-containing protein [Sulfurovum sp. TSL6]